MKHLTACQLGTFCTALRCFIFHPVCRHTQTKTARNCVTAQLFPHGSQCECRNGPGCFPFSNNVFLAGGNIEFFVRTGNTSDIPVCDGSSYQCSEGFIFTGSVNPKSRRVLATNHKADLNQSNFSQRGRYCPYPDRPVQHSKLRFVGFFFWADCKRSFLACMPVNSICHCKFKCFGDVKGLLELWQLRRSYIKALQQGELDRVEQKCCDKIPEWRCLFKWCHVSGAY